MLAFRRSKSVVWNVNSFGKCFAKQPLKKSPHLYCATKAYSSVSGPDSDFYQKSAIPTDHFQPSLPRLPVPDLDKTCERYLKSQEPVLSQEDHVKTQAIVNRFKEGEGKVLQEELKANDKSNKKTSYISGPWFDMYLKDNRPVALNHNPFMAMNDDPRPEYNTQLIRATNFLISSARFMKTLKANVLEPDMFHLNPAKSDNDKFRSFVRKLPSIVSWYGAYWYKVFPLDVSQYPRLFNSTRIPRVGKDELYTDASAKHMLIMRNGNFYIFDIFDKDGNIVADTEILANVKYILEDKPTAPEFPIAVFTAEERDTWAEIRQKLVQAGNEAQLQQIDSAAFCLNLDDTSPEDPIEMSHIFLHGDGSNRWFDKSFSVIMQKNGTACVNMEHAWGDGVGVLRYFNAMYDDTIQRPRVHPDTQPANIDSSSRVRKLDFNMTDELKQAWKDSKASFDSRVEGLDINFVQHKKFGKNLIKKQKLSPDSFMQLAIQLAFHRLEGKTAATYESCSTAAFRHGRTETVRSCTSATKRACELFAQKPHPSISELQAAMTECSNVHNELTKNAAMGQGWDRHLFALRYLASGKGQQVELFEDPAYKTINHIILSTSTLTAPSLLIGGFGPVVPDGFGIGYGVQDNQLGCIVSGYRANRDVNSFLQCMLDSLEDMSAVVEGRDFK